MESFRISAQGSDPEDDLLDAFCYGIALALGNTKASNSCLLFACGLARRLSELQWLPVH
jgi:hypothetical protein